MHALLAQQLDHCFGNEAAPSGPAFKAFLHAVEQAYMSADSKGTGHLGESERDALFRMSPDMLCIINQRLELLQVNPSWSRLLGFSQEELVGRHLVELVHVDDRRKTMVEASLLSATGKMTGFENRFRTKSGEWKALAWTATVDLGRGLYFAVGRDVTEQKGLEQELAQAQKLEAVGQLASGIAHEINTPVQFIGSNLQFASDSFDELRELITWARTFALEGPASPHRDALTALVERVDLEYLVEELPRSLHESRDGVRRVAELVQALKDYANPDSAEMAPCDINQALQRTLVLARNEVSAVAELKTELGDLPLLPCHAGSLQQVFLNIVVNAAHAIEEKNHRTGQRGEIRIATALEATEVVVTIRDSGCGIRPEIRDRIFEPFFTTKPVGKGSGQGLALARSVIVEKHRGRIDVDSTLGVGTTLTLRLPLLRNNTEHIKRSAP